MSNFSRWFYAAVLFLAAYWFAGSYLFPPASAEASAPVPPAQLHDYDLCGAWRTDKSDALTNELRTRHLLAPADWPAANDGLPRVGMTRAAIHCVLGTPDTSTEYVTAGLEWTVQTYRRANAPPLVVRIERGLVASYSY